MRCECCRWNTEKSSLGIGWAGWNVIDGKVTGRTAAVKELISIIKVASCFVSKRRILLDTGAVVPSGSPYAGTKYIVCCR